MSVISEFINALAAALPGKIAAPGSEAYVSSISSYFSAFEADISPSYIEQPTSAEDVAALIRALRTALADGKKGVAAIRGGGNMAWPGSANVDGGIIIDMRGLKGVEISADKRTVSVGASDSSLSVKKPNGRPNRTSAQVLTNPYWVRLFSSSN